MIDGQIMIDGQMDEKTSLLGDWSFSSQWNQKTHHGLHFSNAILQRCPGNSNVKTYYNFFPKLIV
jgi:hypothetical protein